MAKLVTIYWRDIPAQVNAQQGRARHQVPLPKRFEDAISSATAVAELFTYHEFVKHWRRVDLPCGQDLLAEATTEAARLNADYSDERLADLIKQGGLDRSP
jgi:hypothetical protein